MVIPNLAKILLPYCHTKSIYNGHVSIYECKDENCCIRKQCGFYDNEVLVNNE